MRENEHDLGARISSLTAALAQVEERLRRLERFVGIPEAAPAPAPTTALPLSEKIETEPDLEPATVEVWGPAAPAVPVRAPALHLPRLSSELEVVIGTSWLNRVGIVAIIAAVAYFLKYSFDNQWVGPSGRVGLTLLFGVLLLLGGERYQRRRLAVFAQGLSGGGIAVLYFGVYAAFAIYELSGFAPAFGLMVLITLAATLLALRYDSLAIAAIGLLGGFATPLFLGDSGGAVTPGLYGYFLLLNAGTYALAHRRGWWRFGAMGMAAAFLTPVIVAMAGRPHGPAAVVYFLLITLGTLALSLAHGLAGLAWVALAGGFLLGGIGGVGVAITQAPAAGLIYFGIVTVATMAVAARQNWRAVAIIAYVVGALMVIGISLPHGGKFAYLAILAVTSLTAAQWRAWGRMELVLLVATQVPASVILLQAVPYPSSLPLPATLSMLAGPTLLFLLFSIGSARASRTQTEDRLVTAGIAAAIYAGQLFLVLGPARRDGLAVAAAALAAYHVLLSQALLRRTFPRLTVLMLLGLAITFLTLAVPLKLSQEAIPLAWAVETAVLAWVARRAANPWAGRAAAVVGTVTAVRLIVVETTAVVAGRLVVSAPGFAFLAGIVGLTVGALWLRDMPWAREEERYIAPGLGAAAAALLLWWGGWEIEGVFRRSPALLARAAGARETALSAWFTLYGVGLVVAGMIRSWPLVRWAGIGLLGATILKVFVLDLAQVAVVFRIASLFVLGILLLVASLVYARYRARISEAPQPDVPAS